jgi:hypothetical protein
MLFGCYIRTADFYIQAKMSGMLSNDKSSELAVEPIDVGSRLRYIYHLALFEILSLSAVCCNLHQLFTTSNYLRGFYGIPCDYGQC